MGEYIKLPKIGLTMKTGTISEINKKVGDSVEKGEVILVFETDKIASEVESPIDGTVLKVFCSEGDEIAVLEPLVFIGTPGEETGLEKAIMAIDPEEENIGVQIVNKSSGDSILAMPLAKRHAKQLGIDISVINASHKDGVIRKDDVDKAFAQQKVRATPLAKQIAREEGIELSEILGTGPRGKITKADVETAKSSEIIDRNVLPPVINGTRKKMSGMRKVIAERLCLSKQTIPHVYFKSEIDASSLVKLNDDLKHKHKDNQIPRITINHIMLKAIAVTLKKHPMMFAQIDGEDIIYFNDVNIGMPVSIEEGLLVPVIRMANTLSLRDLAVTATELERRARHGELGPDECSAGNFTVSNLGAFGIDEFTAIINPPESAIIAIGGIREKAIIKNGEIIICPMISLTLSVDHRLIDGVLAARFMKDLRESIENIYMVLL